MRMLFATLMILFAGAKANAVDFVLYGGGNYSKVDFTTSTFGSVTVSSTTPILGIGGGLGIVVHPVKEWGIELGGLYMKRGWEDTLTKNSFNASYGYAMLRRYAAKGANAGIGFYSANAVSDKITKITKATGVTQEVAFDQYAAGTKINKGDFGGVLSAQAILGAGKGHNLLADLRYYYGFQNVTDSTLISSHFSEYQLLLGYMYGTN